MRNLPIFFRRRMIRNRKIPRHIDVGQVGEKFAVRYLKRHGYRIAERDVNCGRSEIDIIAVKDDLCCFIEIKTRLENDALIKSAFRAADTVNHSKTSYLIRGVMNFCSNNYEKYGRYYKSIDIIELYLREERYFYKLLDVTHFKNAINRLKKY